MDEKYKNILVAVDGSEASEHALNKAIKISLRNDASLIIDHIIDSRTYATAEVYDRSLSERIENHSEELLSTYVEKAKEAGIEKVESIIEYGSPKVIIAKEIAPKNDCDLIIEGATGFNSVISFIFVCISDIILFY